VTAVVPLRLHWYAYIVVEENELSSSLPRCVLFFFDEEFLLFGGNFLSFEFQLDVLYIAIFTR